jgi:hypothetical protein
MLRVLTDKVGSLTASVSAIDQQQHALNLALIRLEPGMPSGESSTDAGSLGLSSGSGLALGDALRVGSSGGLLVIGEVDGLHVIGSNNQCMGGNDYDLRGSGAIALCVNDGGDGLCMIRNDGILTVDSSSSVLSVDGSSGHSTKGLILVPRRSWVRFGSLCPIIEDLGRHTLALVRNNHHVRWSVNETVSLHPRPLLNNDGDDRSDHCDNLR